MDYDGMDYDEEQTLVDFGDELDEVEEESGVEIELLFARVKAARLAGA